MAERKEDNDENYFSLNDVEETEDENENDRYYHFLDQERF